MVLNRTLLTLLTLEVLRFWHGAVAKGVTKGTFFDVNAWNLVRKEKAVPITSLSELKEGVYSIQMSGERMGCEFDAGPGACFSCFSCERRKHTYFLL